MVQTSAVASGTQLVNGQCQMLTMACAGAQVTRGIIGCVVVGHFPLNHHPARLALEDLEAWAFDWRSISPALSTFQTVAFVVSSIAVAEVVGRCCAVARGCWAAVPACGCRAAAQLAGRHAQSQGGVPIISTGERAGVYLHDGAGLGCICACGAGE